MILFLLYSLIGIIVLLALLIYIKLLSTQKRCYDIFRSQGIVGERYIPLIGQLLDMNRANQNDKGLEYFEDLQKKHGRYFLFGFGPLTRLIVVDPPLLSDFFSRTTCLNYHKPTELTNILKPILGKQNLVVSEGFQHDRARKMLNPAFHFTNLRSMISIFSNEAMKTVDNFFLDNRLTNEINVETEMTGLTLSIITSCAFGQNFQTNPELKHIMCDLMNEMKELTTYRTFRMLNQIEFLSNLPLWGKTRIDECSKQINDYIDKLVQDRRNGKTTSLCSGNDTLDLLLTATDEEGNGFSDQQVRDEALTFVGAGHETTSNLLTWTIYMLTMHDDVLKACQEEVDRILPDKTIPTFEEISRLDVIESVLNETLRLYPPVPFFARQCIKEHTLKSTDGKTEIHVPVNAVIMVQTHALHRMEEYWPRPLEFDYTRWMRNSTTGLKPKLSHPYAFLPFAAGTRNCIGINFALLEAKVILALLVQRCDFQLVPGQKIVRQMNGITMGPKYGIFATCKRRDN